MLPPYSNIRITDSKLMNYQFFDQSITQFRRYWLPVIDQSTYRRMKSLLLSSQDLTASVKNYFTDEEFTRNTVFEPLPIMEKTRNIIIDQAREAGLKPYIEAVDPAATVDKKQDMFRLKNMQKHIAEVNKVRENVGEQTPYALREKDFNGNVQEFTKMGMNPQDESQVKFFFDTHYKLNYEIAAQTTVLSYLTTNKAENDIPRYCIDIMSVKCFCKQDYVSRLTGQIITKYLQPTNVYVIKGNNRDLSDAACKGWERQITIQELNIYALINPINNSVFYIGCTHCPWVRLNQHISQSRKDNTQKSIIIQEIKKARYDIEMLILDKCQVDNASFWEEF